MITLLLQKKDAIFLILICLIFLSFVLPENNECHCDEVAPGLWGIYLLKNADFKLVNLSTVKIHLFSKEFPVNFIQPYAFALPSYLLIPFFLLFGINLFSLKLLSIFLSVLFLLMTYSLCNRFFNRRVAMITLFLLAINPLLIRFTKNGLQYSEHLLNFFFIGGIFFFAQYYIKKQSRYLFLSSYLFGAGLSIKLSFLSILIGLFFITLIFYRTQAWGFLKANLKSSHKFGAVVFFCIGAFLFIYFNIATKGSTFKLVRFLYTSERTLDGINNLDFHSNFKTRIDHLKNIVEGNPAGVIEGNLAGVTHVNPVRRNALRFFFSALILNLIFLMLFKRNNPDLKKGFSIYTFYTAIFFSSCFSPRGLRPFHLALLYPFPQFIVASFIDNLCHMVVRINLKPFLRISVTILILLTILTPLAVNDLNTIFSFYSIWKKAGGNRFSLPNLRAVLDYIRMPALNKYPIYYLGLDLDDTIRFLTQGKFGFSGGSEFFYSRWKDILEEGIPVYILFPAEQQWIKDRFELFLEKDLSVLGHQVTLEKTFYNRISEPQYYLYRLD